MTISKAVSIPTPKPLPMSTARDVIPDSRRRCAWVTGKLMWGVVYRVPGAKPAFDVAMRTIFHDEPHECMSMGQRLWVNPCASIVELRLTTCGVYEPDLVDYLQSALAQGMTVVDMGANIGFITLLASDLVGPTGRVVSFEPNPTTFARLRRNLELNGRPNVTALPLALSDRAGRARLTASDDHALVALADRPGAGVSEVDTDTLDAALERVGLQACDLIKMDIEGAEWMAVRGMRSTMRAFPRAALLIEVHPRGIARFGGTTAAFARCLLDEGYRLYWLGERARLREIAPGEYARLSGHIVCRRDD